MALRKNLGSLIFKNVTQPYNQNYSSSWCQEIDSIGKVIETQPGGGHRSGKQCSFPKPLRNKSAVETMSPIRVLLLVTFLYVYFTLQLAGADDIARIGHDEESFVEKYDPNVNVSGQIRAGFMLTSDAEKVQLDSMYVYFTQATGSKGEVVCFRLASRDGVYSAKWQFTLVEVLKNAILVDIPTKKTEELAHYAADSLVAIATLGKNCRDKRRVYVPASWGLQQHDRDSEEQNMRIYLNSDATETSLKVHIKDAAKTNAVVDSTCSKIPSTEQTVAFDTICDFSLAPQSTLRMIGVKRENFGNDLDGIRFAFRTDP